MMNEFGRLLNYYRRQSQDPERGGPLTQERLAELLEETSGVQYTGATVSNWERSKSYIDPNDRSVLAGLIKALYRCNGLRSPQEANRLLAAGNYRSLNEAERKEVTPAWLEQEENNPGDSGTEASANAGGVVVAALLRDFLRHPGDIWRDSGLDTMTLSSQSFAAQIETVLTSLFRRWLSIIAWLALWLMVWTLTFPLLRWSPDSAGRLEAAVGAFVAGGLIIPAAAGLLVYRARERAFWRRQSVVGRALLFLSCLGALAGFQLGYGLLFTARLLAHYAGLRAAPDWLLMITAGWPLLLSYVTARQLPFHYWGAFGRLRLTQGDWGIALILLFFTPFLGGALFLVYEQLLQPEIGLPLILATIVLAVLLSLSERRLGKPLLPFLYLPLVISLFVLQRQSPMATAILFGLGIHLFLALWRNEIKMNITTTLGLLSLALLSTFFYVVEITWLGRITAVIFLLAAGWYKWRGVIIFPTSLIALGAVAFASVMLVHQEILPERTASISFIIVVIFAIWLRWR